VSLRTRHPSIREGRSPIVLTERREHATLLAGHLERHAPKLVVLMGGKGVRERRAVAARLAALAPDEPPGNRGHWQVRR